MCSGLLQPVYVVWHVISGCPVRTAILHSGLAHTFEFGMLCSTGGLIMARHLGNSNMRKYQMWNLSHQDISNKVRSPPHNIVWSYIK